MIKAEEYRKGYKKTSLGWIPEDWEEKKLSELGNTFTGLTYKPEDLVDEKTGTLVLRSSNIQNSYIALKDNVYVKTKILERTKVKNGDILLCVRNGSRSLIGKSARINKECEGMSFGAFMSVYRSDYNDYLIHLFQSGFFQKEILKNLGATINQITSKDLLGFKIYLPLCYEQKAISYILNLWCLSIDKMQKLIVLKEKRKKALMRQLLTEKKRIKGFKDKWKNKYLEDILIPTLRPVNKPSDLYLSLGIRSHGKGTFIKNNVNPEDIDIETLYKVKENDLILNITFAWEGAIAIVKKEDDGALVSHRFPTYTFNNENGIVDFFRYIIIQPRFKYLLETISPGGAGRNRVLSKKDFLKLEVNIPSVEEQKAISNILLAADKEIELLKQKLELLNKQKQGLMQVLLTGKVRLMKFNN